MSLSIRKLWARAVGLKGWDRQTRILHNIVGDGTPAPGVLPGRPVPTHNQDQPPLTNEERKRRYEEWEGEEPGH